MAGAEGVVDVEVGELAQLLRRSRDRSFLRRRGSGGSRAAALRPASAPTLRFASSPTQSSAHCTSRPSSSASFSRTGSSEYFALRSPFGRPRWMAMTIGGSALAEQAQRRQRLLDARGVGDARAVERHVVVDAIEDARAVAVEMCEVWSQRADRRSCDRSRSQRVSAPSSPAPRARSDRGCGSSSPTRCRTTPGPCACAGRPSG